MASKKKVIVGWIVKDEYYFAEAFRNELAKNFEINIYKRKSDYLKKYPYAEKSRKTFNKPKLEVVKIRIEIG